MGCIFKTRQGERVALPTTAYRVLKESDDLGPTPQAPAPLRKRFRPSEPIQGSSGKDHAL